MKPDVTIAEAVGGIKKPDAYLDGVIVHMRSCRLAYGNAFLRLGASLQGTGQYPSYRITFLKDGVEEVFGSFFDSHKSFPKPYDKIVPGAWSTSATKFEDVVVLRDSLSARPS
ncbi:MAG: hypothetical protein OTI36_10830 [Beijerinckiaceae bacterium]|nr:hypothetical protein [Beijerinckiaceae bacterium]